MDVSRQELRAWVEEKLDALQAALADPAAIDDVTSNAHGELRAVTELARRFELVPDGELDARTAAITATLEWNFEP